MRSEYDFTDAYPSPYAEKLHRSSTDQDNPRGKGAMLPSATAGGHSTEGSEHQGVSAEEGKARSVAEKRTKPRSLVGAAELPNSVDGKAIYRQHLIEKCAPGVRQ